MTRRLEFHRYLACETGSAERAREQEADIQPRGTYAWWCRFEDGDPPGRCKGHKFSDGPCAHLFAVWNHTARYERRSREIVDVAALDSILQERRHHVRRQHDDEMDDELRIHQSGKLICDFCHSSAPEKHRDNSPDKALSGEYGGIRGVQQAPPHGRARPAI